MKNLLLTLLLVPMFSLAAINIEPDTGDIVETYPGFSTVLGNVTDVYDIERELVSSIKQSQNCSQAMMAAADNASIAFDGKGVYLGGGFGFSGSCSAGSMGLTVVTDYDLSFSSSVTQAFNNTIGS